MFHLGFGEIVLVAGIVLVIVGPERLTGIARWFARTVRALRAYVDELKNDVHGQLQAGREYPYDPVYRERPRPSLSPNLVGFAVFVVIITVFLGVRYGGGLLHL